MEYIFRGKLEPDLKTLKILDAGGLEPVLKKLTKYDLRISVEQMFDDRSHAQNNYFHAVVIPTIQTFVQETQGETWNKDQVKKYIYETILGNSFVEQKNGSWIMVEPRFSQMDTKEFNEAKETVQRHFAEMGCFIRDPRRRNLTTDFSKIRHMKEIRLCFDASLLIWSNYFVQLKLNQTPTEETLADRVRQNIMNIYKAFQDENHIVEMVLCADQDSFRRDLWSGYKANRTVFPLDRMKILDMLSKKTLFGPGLEADDVMFLYSNKYDNVVLITEDLDLKQAVVGSTVLFRYKQGELLDEEDVNVQREILSRLIFGCKSDNVPKSYVGKKRLGEKTLDRQLEKLDEDKLFDLEFVREFLTFGGYTIDSQQFEMNKDLVIYSLDIYEKYIPKIKQIYNSL